MTLAKSSLEIARGYLDLVPARPSRSGSSRQIAAEHERTVAAVLEIVEAKALLDRHPVVQRSIGLRNPYVDPMNAIQVELLRRYRAGGDEARAAAAAPLDRRHRRRHSATPASAAARARRGQVRVTVPWDCPWGMADRDTAETGVRPAGAG